MIQNGSILDMMMGSSFENPGFMTSNPSVIQSFISDKGNNTSTSSNVNGQFSNAEDFFYNESMLSLLRNWELTQSILDIFKTTIVDIYSSSDPKISTGESSLDDEINKFIKSIGLQSYLLDNIEDDLYYGQRAFYIDIDSKAILNFSNSRNFDQVRYLGRPYKYRFIDKDKNLGEKSLIDYNKICCISFNTKIIGNGKSDKLKLTKDKVLDNILRDLEYLRGQSALKSVLYIIFQHFLKSLLSSLLSLKNTLRPDLIKANVQPGSNQEINIVEAINNIEAFLNQGEYTFDFRTSNATAIISNIYNSLVNSIKVVPGLANYTDFDMIQIPDITGKIEALNRDIMELRSNAISNVGIPEELVGGTSNRWEVISRSTRYYSVIKSFIDPINDVFKQVAKLYIYVKHKRNVSIDSIEFNLGSNNYLYSIGMTNRLQLLSDNLERVNMLMRSISDLSSSPICNKVNTVNYVKNFLSSTDSKLADLINLEGANQLDGSEFEGRPLPGGMLPGDLNSDMVDQVTNGVSNQLPPGMSLQGG